MDAAKSMQMHREHGGTDQTWSGCWSCMTARRTANAQPTQVAIRRSGVTIPCRRCHTYCAGDCSAN